MKDFDSLCTAIPQGVQLELLDVGRDHQCGDWGKELPRRLKQMHSHWLCR